MTEILHPLPVEATYAAAADAYTTFQDDNGGPWTYAYKSELAASRSQKKYDEVYNAGKIAVYIEPLDSENKPLDSLSRRTHAFKHGILAGYKLISTAHDELIPSVGATTFLAITMNEYTTADSNYTRGEVLTTLGERGLDRMGSRATDKIDQWGEDIFPDVRIQRSYKLGCGAVIHAAYSIHQEYINNVIDKRIQAYDWQQGIGLFGTSTSSE